MAFSQSARSACLSVSLCDWLFVWLPLPLTLLLPHSHLSFSLSVLSCSSYFICNFWKYFAYATFAGMGRRHVDYNNIRHKSGSQLTPQSVTTSLRPPSSPSPPSIVWKFHTHVSDNFLRHSVLFCCSPVCLTHAPATNGINKKRTATNTTINNNGNNNDNNKINKKLLHLVSISIFFLSFYFLPIMNSAQTQYTKTCLCNMSTPHPLTLLPPLPLL